MSLMEKASQPSSPIRAIRAIRGSKSPLAIIDFHCITFFDRPTNITDLPKQSAG